ncbi:MAG: flagellar export protein FliJ [Fusobacteriia bacterium 4572_132]|nr:MAG: flagellar export protein FliJ [Fusobacteriia bacterium 4572_132]
MFKFKFEKALDFKRKTEEIARGEFSKSKNEKLEEERKIKILKKKKEVFLNKSITKREGKLDIILLQQTNKQLEKFKKEIMEQEEYILKKEAEIEEKKEELLEAVKEVKIFEKLNEREYSKYKEEEKRKENSFLDEITNNNYNRGR